MSITLPNEKSKVDRQFTHQVFGMIGLPGIGKSSFWAQEPKALFFDTENGLGALEVFKVPIRCWQDLRDTYVALQEALKQGKYNYDLLIIDTMDNLIDYAEEEVIAKAQTYYKKVEINVIGDIPEGKGWDERRRLVSSFLNRLSIFPSALAFISHSEIKKIEDPLGKYDKSTIAIGGKIGGDLLAFPGHILNVEAMRVGDRLQRTVFTLPTQSREAKSRGGLVPNNWKWSDDMKENYDNFRKLFV